MTFFGSPDQMTASGARLRINRSDDKVSHFKRELFSITKRGIEHELEHEVAPTH